MRRILGAALLVSGCFHPEGSVVSDSKGDGTTSTATSTVSTGPAPTTGPDGTTTTATSGAATSTTGEPATSSTSDTTTSGTTTSGTTTADLLCDPPCATCQTCVAGQCVLSPPETPCDPDPLACDDVVFGEFDGTCYKSIPVGGACDGGACVPACYGQGPGFVTCVSASCVKPGNPCMKGAAASAVTQDALCASGDTETPGCALACENDAVIDYKCTDDGTCTAKSVTQCSPYTCDVVTPMCATSCMLNGDCAVNHYCDITGMPPTCKPA